MRRRAKRRGEPPRICRICGAPIAWIRGLRTPVNPLGVEVVPAGFKADIEGVDHMGLPVRGRLYDPDHPPASEHVVRRCWTRHICDPAAREAHRTGNTDQEQLRERHQAATDWAGGGA